MAAAPAGPPGTRPGHAPPKKKKGTARPRGGAGGGRTRRERDVDRQRNDQVQNVCEWHRQREERAPSRQRGRSARLREAVTGQIDVDRPRRHSEHRGRNREERDVVPGEDREQPGVEDFEAEPGEGGEKKPRQEPRLAQESLQSGCFAAIGFGSSRSDY